MVPGERKATKQRKKIKLEARWLRDPVLPVAVPSAGALVSKPEPSMPWSRDNTPPAPSATSEASMRTRVLTFFSTLHVASHVSRETPSYRVVCGLVVVRRLPTTPLGSVAAAPSGVISRVRTRGSWPLLGAASPESGILATPWANGNRLTSVRHVGSLLHSTAKQRHSPTQSLETPKPRSASLVAARPRQVADHCLTIPSQAPSPPLGQ